MSQSEKFKLELQDRIFRRIAMGKRKKNKEQRFWHMLFGRSSRKTGIITVWGFHLPIVKKD